MSKRAERSGDGWGRDPASLDLTPDSYSDRTVDPTPGSSDGTDEEETVDADPDPEAESERPTSETADTLVRRAMAESGTNPARDEAYETFGVVGHRPEE